MSQHAQLREKTQQLSSRSNWASRQRLEEEQKSHLEADDNFPLQPLPFLPVGVIIDTKHTKSLKKQVTQKTCWPGGMSENESLSVDKVDSRPLPQLPSDRHVLQVHPYKSRLVSLIGDSENPLQAKPKQMILLFQYMGEGGLVGYFLAHWGYI